MSDEAAAPAKKKGGMKKMIMIAVGALVLIGGGIGAGLYAAGSGLVGGHAVEVEDPNKPKLVPKKAEGGEEGKAYTPKGTGDGTEKFDRTKYQASYYPITDTFTSNLRDTDGFMQVGIGVATFYDERVTEAMKTDEMPIRSAVLMTLANQDAMAISTPEGKKQLQKELKDAINQVLISREGFGGIDDVYFTSLIIQ